MTLETKKVHCRLQYPKLIFISLINMPHKILNYLYAIKLLNGRHIGTTELVRNFGRYSEMKFTIIQALEIENCSSNRCQRFGSVLYSDFTLFF